MISSKRTAVFLLVLAALAPEAGASTASLQLRLTVPGGGAGLPGMIQVRMLPVDAQVGDRTQELPVTAGAVAPLQVAAGEWEVCVAAPGFWSPCRRVTAAEASLTQVAVDLWPGGFVTGTLRAPAASRPGRNDAPEAGEQPVLPQAVRLHFAPADRHLVLTGAGSHSVQKLPPLPEGDADCRVEPGPPEAKLPTLRWTCPAPAGTLDLQVRPGGFMPAYDWDVEVPPGGEVDLGDQELRRGSSVVGTVAVEDGTLDPATATVSLVPMLPSGTGRRAAQRLAEARWSAAVGPRRFFQVAAVPPGTYVLHVEQPGLAPGRFGPVEVTAGLETVLPEPVVLRPPLTLRFAIHPPLDWMGQPWRVSLTPAPDFAGVVDTSLPEDRQAGDDGVVRFPERAPGVYMVQVHDAAGQSFHFDPAVRAESSADAHRAIEIPLVMVEGRLRLGDEPLQATLWFGGRHGGEQAEMASDAEGRFVGTLPRPGSWTVDIEAAEPAISRRVRVPVDAKAGGGGELDIRLPDTRLFGSVVREDGRPVAGAEVSVQSDGLGNRGTTDDDGRFELRGLEPGPATVSARKELSGELLDSDTLLVNVAEDAPGGPVVIRLRPVRTLRGRVLSAAGAAVPGAVVELSTLHPVTAMFHSAARTGADGGFEIQARADADMLQAVVSAPGHALTVLRAPPRQPLDLPAEPEGGTLVLHLAAAGAPEARALLLSGDLSISMTTVLRWARSHGETPRNGEGLLRVPRVAPGPYRLCSGTLAGFTEALAESGDWTQGLDTCDEGYLAPGGELHLLRGGSEPPAKE